jgi:hypothetical protein
VIQNKPCISCGVPGTSEFYVYAYTTNQGKRSLRRDSRCKACARARRKARYDANPQRDLKASLAWKRKNVALCAAYRKEYFSDEEGRAYRAERQQKRESAKKQRTVAWADEEKIAAFYRLAAAFSELYVPHEVDHMVPLQGKLVSGLHTHDNLQVITSFDNRSKKNRFEIAA